MSVSRTVRTGSFRRVGKPPGDIQERGLKSFDTERTVLARSPLEGKVYKLVCILNAVMVLPFAVTVLVAPEFTFGQFGLDLGPEGAGVARGYGATALGWGIACVLLSGLRDAAVVRAILVASLAFNAVEVLVQVPVAFSGIASAMIWTTIVGHAVTAALSAVALFGPAGVRAHP
jgi:hypothetical protein